MLLTLPRRVLRILWTRLRATETASCNDFRFLALLLKIYLLRSNIAA